MLGRTSILVPFLGLLAAVLVCSASLFAQTVRCNAASSHKALTNTIWSDL